LWPWPDDWKLPPWPKIPNAKEIVSRMQLAVEDSVHHVINLIVVFLLQTIVLPLAFLWLIVAGGRTALRRGVPFQQASTLAGSVRALP
jgi:hypothetical protein